MAALLFDDLLEDFRSTITFDPMVKLQEKQAEKLPVDYFEFYNAVSSVYSSKIEGENIDFDSFYKHKFLNVPYQSDYTKRSDDLFKAYQFILEQPLTLENTLKAHEILSQHLLPESQRDRIRNNPMYVLNDEDRIEYVACPPSKVRGDLEQLFEELEVILEQKMDAIDSFYYAALLHLVFVKIHPMQDGNGRTARLLEKWFLIERLGKQAMGIELEENYYRNRADYYDNIRQLGLEYETLDYQQALPFLLMSVLSLK
ncbi:MAG: Fic family protein [Bacteroidota bacterium]